MSLRNKSVMITGGAGFIGSHLADQLILQGVEAITIVDNFFLGKERNIKEARTKRKDLKVHVQDVADQEAMGRILRDEGTDVVFNLAVVPLPASLEKPAWTFTQNVNMTLTICELARQGLFETLIHFSSSEAYGNSISGPMDENHPLNGTTPYAASKAAGDLLILSYCRTFGIDAAIIRPFNNYGPRQNEASYAGVIPITIASIMRGESPHIFGDGKQTRDYLYVTDTANAAIKMYDCKNTREKVLNIASGKEISINYLVRLIADLMAFRGEIIYEPDRPADVKRHIANIYLAEDIVDFKQTVPFEEGMRRTLDWYKQNISL